MWMGISVNCFNIVPKLSITFIVPFLWGAQSAVCGSTLLFCHRDSPVSWIELNVWPIHTVSFMAEWTFELRSQSGTLTSMDIFSGILIRYFSRCFLKSQIVFRYLKCLTSCDIWIYFVIFYRSGSWHEMALDRIWQSMAQYLTTFDGRNAMLTHKEILYLMFPKTIKKSMWIYSMIPRWHHAHL